MPSIVPPNQTQASVPSASQVRFGAWFWMQGDGKRGLDTVAFGLVRAQQTVHHCLNLAALEFARR